MKNLLTKISEFCVRNQCPSNQKNNVNKYANIDQLRYLSQSASIEEYGHPNFMRNILFIMCFTVILLILWSSIAKISEIAITQGDVVPSNYVQSIQHLEGGIIKNIKVQEGDVVEEGQVIVKLDDTSIKRDLLTLKLEHISMKYKAHSLKSFIYKTKPDFKSISDEDHEDLERSQQAAFESILDELKNEKEVIEKQIAQKKDILQRLIERHKTSSKNINILEQEKELKESLLNSGNLSKISMLKTRRQFNNLKGEIAELDSEMEQAKNAINEYEERLDSLNSKYIGDAYEELNNVNNNIAKIEEKIAKIESQIMRLEIRAPMRGLIKSLKFKTIGAVVNSGEVISELVPLDGDLLVEIRINPQDIANIKIGQYVTLKITAYNFARYGTLDGELIYVSATTFNDQEGNSYYLGRVKLQKSYFGDDPEINRVIPGMTAQADIVLGDKSILTYLLRPVYSATSTALSEK